MKNILLLNGGKKFAHSHGRLNDTLQAVAAQTLAAAGFALRQTKIDSGYDIEEEVRHFLWADLVIYQMPGWWMGAPWIVKKYMDEVLPPVMAFYAPVMAVAVPTPSANMAPVGCCMANTTCSH